MKLVYCVQQTYKSGGVERVLTSKANWFAQRGYEVIIITTEQKGNKPFFPLDDRIRQVDLAINYWDNTKRSGLKKLFYFIKSPHLHKRKLERLLCELKPDIVVSLYGHDMHHLPTIRDGSVKILEYHFTHQRIVNMFRQGFYKVWDYLNYLQQKRTIKKYEKFIVLTEMDKESWGGGDYIDVIPNPLSYIPNSKSSLSSKTAIAVGRLVYEKGLDRLLDIWERVYPVCPDWKLHIIGDGYLEDQLHQMIIDKGLQGVVSIYPAKSDISEEYKNASMLLLASRYEGLGMVLIEGQSYGLPCVSFDVPCGPSSIISDGIDGFLIPDDKIDMFANKVQMLAKDVDLRIQMGECAMINALRFEKNNIMTQWEKLFNELTRA